MIYTCIRGQSTNADVYFRDSNRNPIDPQDTSASFEVRDYSDNMIVSGYAVQDTADSSHWSATFTVPEMAPVSDQGDKYKIHWRLRNYVYTEFFLLVASGEPTPRDISIAMLEGTLFKDSIGLPVIPTSLELEIRNIHGERIYPRNVPVSSINTSVENILLPNQEVDTSTYRMVGNTYYFEFQASEIISDLISGSYGANAYFVLWHYDLPGSSGNVDIHPLYVLNVKAIKYINDLKHSLDKAKVNEFDPSLGFSTAELAHYVLSGIQRINVNAPQFTNFNINSIPDEFSYLVSKAALWEAYHSAYLAEGLKAFEFTGQSTTLNVDRTQYYQLLMDNLTTYLDTAIKNAKTIYYRSGAGSRFGLGALSVSMNPNTTIPYSLPNSFLSNFRWR